MATPSVPEPTHERKIRDDWFIALGEAQTRPADPERFLTGPEIRAAAEGLAPLLMEPHGPESPPVYRAVADLVTRCCHPTVLLLLLAGCPTTPEARRWWKVWR